VGECDLIDDEYRPKMQGASEQLIRQEDELRATLSELQKRYDQLFLQEMQCQSSIGDKTKELEQLNNNIEAMKLQEQELIDQKQKFEKDVRTAKRIFKDKDKKYKELCRKLTEAEQDLSNINSMRETASDNLQSIQDQAEGTSRVVDDLETRKKNLESEAQVLSSQAKPLVS
jgi:chromosome segregation ATPase